LTSSGTQSTTLSSYGTEYTGTVYVTTKNKFPLFRDKSTGKRKKKSSDKFELPVDFLNHLLWGTHNETNKPLRTAPNKPLKDTPKSTPEPADPWANVKQPRTPPTDTEPADTTDTEPEPADTTDTEPADTTDTEPEPEALPQLYYIRYPNAAIDRKFSEKEVQQHRVFSYDPTVSSSSGKSILLTEMYKYNEAGEPIRVTKKKTKKDGSNIEVQPVVPIEDWLRQFADDHKIPKFWTNLGVVRHGNGGKAPMNEKNNKTPKQVAQDTTPNIFTDNEVKHPTEAKKNKRLKQYFQKCRTSGLCDEVETKFKSVENSCSIYWRFVDDYFVIDLDETGDEKLRKKGFEEFAKYGGPYTKSSKGYHFIVKITDMVVNKKIANVFQQDKWGKVDILGRSTYFSSTENKSKACNCT